MDSGAEAVDQGEMLEPRRDPPRWASRLVGWITAVWPESRRGRTVATVIVLTALVALVAVAFLLPLLVDTRGVGAVLLGYVAMVISNAVATATFPIPGLSIVGQALIAVYGADHSWILAGVVGGTAMSLGQIPNYAVGAVAIDAVEGRLAGHPKLRHRFDKVIADVERRGWVAVSTLSFIPNPFTTLGDIAAGYSGMRFRTFFLAAWCARLVRALLIAYFGNAFLQGLVD